MPLLSKRELVDNDPWVFVEADDPIPAAPSHLALSLDRIADLSDEGRPSEALGLVIDGDADFEEVVSRLPEVKLVAVRFPVLRDGRGFSLARLIRAAGFDGEIRALGEVSQDRLLFLERCGFDSVQLPDGVDLEAALGAYAEISVRYQGCEDTPKAIYSQTQG